MRFWGSEPKTSVIRATAFSAMRANTHAGFVCHQSVDSIEFLQYFLSRKSQHLTVNDCNFRQMYLMRHQQTMVFDAQQLAQSLTISLDGLFAVAAIAVDVKLAIASFAIAALSCAAEGCHALAQGIVLQYGFLCHHGAKLRVFFGILTFFPYFCSV